MFTNTKCSIYAGQNKVYTESVCLSTDTKPTTGIANGSTCIEMNTGKKFMFNEDAGEWVEVPDSSGGGGGSSDFSTAEVTITVEGGTHPGGAFPFLLDEGVPALCVEEFYHLLGQTQTYTVPLYKGECDVVCTNATVSITGDIEKDGNNYYITGDCTITIS